MDLSIIIVNYNTKKLTENCVNSIVSTVKNISYEILIVDNSTKKSESFEVDKSKSSIIKLIGPVENKGFGNACNIGVNNANGDYILLINSDMIVYKDTIDKSVEYIKTDSSVGVLGVRILLPDKTLEHGCKRGFPTPAASFYYFMGFDKRHPENHKMGAYRQTFIDENTTSKVDAVSGSYMLISKKLYKEVNGFDEKFFMYGEDLDLCYRINEKNKKVIYFAEVSALHLHGQSGLSHDSPAVIYHFYNSMKIFYKKHYQKKYNFLINAIVYLAINLKYFLAKLKIRKS